MCVLLPVSICLPIAVVFLEVEPADCRVVESDWVLLKRESFGARRRCNSVLSSLTSTNMERHQNRWQIDSDKWEGSRRID